MRAAAIFGLAASDKDLGPFRLPGVEFTDKVTGSDAALIFGGDGTVHRWLEELVATQVPLLVAPVGSGNDFAREIGVGTVALAAAAWKKFLGGQSPRAIDLGQISFDDGRRVVYCCVAGLGLDADANHRANAMPNWLKRHGGYTLAAIQSILAWKPQRVRVTAGERVLDEAATMVAIGNAPAYGDGMYITPRARFDDARLDVCFVRQVPKLRLLRLFPTVFRGAHLGLQEIEYLQAERLRVETEMPLEIRADGEHAGYTPATFSALPRALRVIVP